MNSVRALTLTLCVAMPAALTASPAARAETSGLVEKINAYVGCINRLSERSYDSRERYLSWVGKKGPTGKERIIYGTYTIYDTSDCASGVEKAETIEPRDEALEAAASAYVTAVVALEPLLKEADDYYTQEDYKDDKMAKGKAMHPKLIAAWDTFATADQKLRAGIDDIQDKMAGERLAKLESTEGRNARYHIEALMMQAKRVMRAQSAGRPDLAAITSAVGEYDEIVKATESYADANKENNEQKIGSMFVSSAKSFLVTAKQLMRRIRDKVPYSSGEKMILNSGGGAWMVDGSPARMMRDYNELVSNYNRGASF